MPRHDELRSRVLRLTHGVYHPEDFSKLLLWLRRRAFGAHTVQEIGDFIAHSDDRIKGLVTNELKDYFLTVRFYVENMNSRLDAFDLPPDTLAVARITLRRIDNASVKKALGLTKKTAESIFDFLAPRLLQKSNGRYTVIGVCSEIEMRVLLLCLGLVLKPAFIDKDLIRDFAFVLEKNQLLLPKEKAALKNAGPALTLRAIEAMHLTQVSIGNGWTALLYGAILNDRLCVLAGAGMNTSVGTPVNIAVPIFKTDLLGDKYCDPKLRQSELWHDIHVEMTSQQSLKIL